MKRLAEALLVHVGAALGILAMWCAVVALEGCSTLHEGERAKVAGLVEVEGMAWRADCGKTTRADLDKRARRVLDAVTESPKAFGPNPLLDSIVPGDELSKTELEEIFASPPQSDPKIEWCNPLAVDLDCRHVTEVIFDHYWAARELAGCESQERR